MQMLNNTGDVIDALGGEAEVASVVRVKEKTVYAWRQRGFPPTTFLVLTAALALKGYGAPNKLWKMREGNRQALKVSA